MPWYAGKIEIREYLQKLNEHKKAGPHPMPDFQPSQLKG